MGNNPNESEQMTFWEHVEVLRKIVFRCLGVWAACAVAAFVFKDWVFETVFAPSRSDFVLYRLLGDLATTLGWEQLRPEAFEVSFINTQLSSQFMTHLSISMWAGVVVALPYLIFELYRFIAPALYDHEKHYSYILIVCSFVLFGAGILLNYFLIFPLSFRFLSTYQVDTMVVNQIALSSYTSTLLLLSLMMGIIFEIPILAYFLAKLGVINDGMLRTYRKHAFVAICIIAAVITPTADIFTLLLVACPIALLYELSIVVVRRTQRHVASEEEG